jgi:hypothetical protein
LEQIHPDPYSAFGGKDGFDKAVKQLRDELANRDTLTLNEMQVEVTKLISALHDGHTYIGYDKAPKKVEDRWIPLKLKVIPDGIIVIGYTPELESLKGAMLCEVEGELLESVLDRLDKLVVSENRFGLMGKACRSIGNNNTLRQLFPTFNKEQVSMKFRTPEEIYVVTDVQTFSSAFHTAYMLWKMGAKVVGVPSGQAPNTFMEVTRFKLPNTGLECSASNSLQSCFPTDHPMAKTFTPDIQLSYDDYRQFDFSKDAELLFIEKQK